MTVPVAESPLGRTAGAVLLGDLGARREGIWACHRAVLGTCARSIGTAAGVHVLPPRARRAPARRAPRVGEQVGPEQRPGRKIRGMMRLGLAVAAMVCLIVAPPPANALENGLGKLPGLGWNSDYCTNCSGPIPWSRPGFGAGLRGHGADCSLYFSLLRLAPIGLSLGARGSTVSHSPPRCVICLFDSHGRMAVW
jgi:hypothetical protein